MMITNKNAINTMVLCLKELSDVEYQKKIWVRGEGPDVSSYTEAICGLFDDTGIGDQLDNIKSYGIVISAALDPILQKISDLVDSIGGMETDADVLAHPKWPRVVALASQALKLTGESENMRSKLESARTADNDRYHLVCITCGTVLQLGRLVCQNEDHALVPWQFGGWLDLMVYGEIFSGVRLWPFVEKFLILHRGHELNVLPETFLDHVDPEKTLTYIYYIDKLLNEPVDPEPDAYKDADRISQTIFEKLKKKVEEATEMR
ncbi:hypothetical protein LJC47_05895 [Desulfosarcina sp. OttesenSCG-928-B08]|nr:hypothetical protein [Desulfosarcina sp. OttesenSCG-928-B08]